MSLDPLHNSDSGCDCEDCSAAHAANEADQAAQPGIVWTRLRCACGARKEYRAAACGPCLAITVEDEDRTTPIPVETIDTIRVTDPLRKFNQEDNR